MINNRKLCIAFKSRVATEFLPVPPAVKATIAVPESDFKELGPLGIAHYFLSGLNQHAGLPHITLEQFKREFDCWVVYKDK